jgi:flagellar motor switch/type III secretory pathway protein FliN
MTTAQSIPAQGVPTVPVQGALAARGVPTPAPGVPAPVQGLPTARAPLPPRVAAESMATQAAALALPEDEAPIFAPQILLLPVELDVMVGVRNFRVRNLLALQPEALIESQWANGEAVPLAAGAVRVAWGEFEVVDNELAVRVTRLA